MIWFALIIPIITSVVLYLYFNRKVLWWEFAIPFVSSVIIVVTITTISFYSQTSDYEYNSYYAQKAVYNEHWNELVHYTVTTTDEDGNTHTEHKTRVDEHPEYWYYVLNDETKILISQEKYEELKKRWGNKPKFVDMKRNYYTKDGDRYVVDFDNNIQHTEPYNSSSNYVNRIKASNSVFKFKNISDTKELFDYPIICDDIVPAVLGDCKNKDAINKFLQYQNACINSEQKCHMFLLIIKNKSIQTAIDQEQYWKGGKRNDFVMCIGLDMNENVTWAYSFSWTEKDTLKAKLNQYAMDMKQWDGIKFAQYYSDRIKKEFVIKNFDDFDYIKIDSTSLDIILAYVITLLINIAVSFYVVKNEFEEEKPCSNLFKEPIKKYRDWWK